MHHRAATFPQPASPKRGFTLIEVMLAMAITAVVAGMLYAVMRAGYTASRVTADAAGGSRALVLVADRMERTIESAVPPRGLLAGPLVGEDNEVELNDTLSFHAAVDPLGTEWGDIVRIEYYLERDADDQLQLLEVITRNLLAPGETPSEVQVLCRGVESLNFRYFDGSGWYDAWDSTQQGNLLPISIEMILILAEPDAEDVAVDDVAATVHRRVDRLISLPCALGQEGGR